MISTSFQRTELTVDIGDGQHLAATLVVPPDVADGTPRIVAFAFPGGGLGRGYFDIDYDGDDSYSQAAFHVSRDWVVVAIDHLGVGDSSQPPPESLTYARLAEADDAAVRAVLRQLNSGTLTRELGPITVRGTVGIGHSMGGCISIVAQGNHGTFDALAVLGFSALATTIPTPTGALDVEHRDRDDSQSSLEEDIAAAGGVGMFRWAFYMDDVAAALVEADMGSGYPRSGSPPPWGSATTPPVVFTMMTPGVVSEEAAAITSPVLLAAGARDVVPDLRAEPTAYRGSEDITLAEIPGMAHMHSMATTRQQLWDRIHRWAESVLPGVDRR